MRGLTAILFFALSVLALGGKPKVGFYSEGLCPYCIRYVHEMLLPLYENGLLAYADVMLYASGNAHLKLNETTGEPYMHCQHGEDECTLNKILSCAIEYSAGLEWLPPVACIEKLGRGALNETSGALDDCLGSAELAQSVEQCYKGEEGQQLFEAAYKATKNLKVPHQWVPWVVVDDVPLYEAGFVLPTAICLSIPKEERPELCYKDYYSDDMESNGAIEPSFVAPRKIATKF